jgi:toxin-antitoxin system PIN domain toxin
VTAFLLDVNVLIALAWPEHALHGRARSWFTQNRLRGWATCPLVEAGFVRIVSNPQFAPSSVSVQEAVDALRASLQDKAHQFWPDSISLPDAVEMLPQPLQGHQQITDAYLIALAMRNEGKLATLDRGMLRLGMPEAVEVIE